MNAISTFIRLGTTTTLLLASIGCSSPSLREGKWALSFIGHEATSGKVFENEESVRLQIETDENGNEIVELERIGSKKGPSERFMYGDIQVGNEGRESEFRKVKFHGNDGYWVFDLRGEIESDTKVKGLTFLARHREDPGTNLMGQWKLEWQSDNLVE